MSIDIIPINDKCQFFDYDNFEESVRTIIGKKCTDAKIFLFNNFPVSVSVETNIDLILVIAIENKKGNYYIPKFKDDKPVYFYNQIIPIKFITNYKDDKLSENGIGQLVANEDFIDYSNEIESIKFSLLKYLSEKCSFKKNELFIQPFIFIENESEIILNNYIVGKTFEFKLLHKYFSKNLLDIYISYKEWNSEIGYNNIPTDLERITDQAQKDSEIGYLTKKKVDRIGKQLSSSKTIFEELNNNLVIINGKAGTGKSSELLLLAMKCISNKQNTIYLTYNKLLIYDIAKTVKSFINSKLNADVEKPGEGTVTTLHSFFYRLSKTLGVLHILNADRIEKLLDVLKTRMRSVYNFISAEFNAQNTDLEAIKTKIQNHNKFDIGTKEVGIDFLNFLKRNNGTQINLLPSLSKEFYNHKKVIVSNIDVNEAFLADYYGVLENTLLQIDNPKEFFEKYNVENKYDILDLATGDKGLSDENFEIIDGVRIITEKGFNTFKNRRVGGIRRKRTVLIDEGQDCHRLEKEILISIFGSANIVVANGGKEQLIRHVELCNWEVSKAKKLNVKKHATRIKSYRIKKTVVDFCNFIAKRFQIDLNLEPFDSEDEGELLIDFRQNHNETEITEIFNFLNLKGKVNGCTPYESLLVLLESNTQREGSRASSEPSIESAIINEYGNIEDSKHKKRGTWKHLEELEKHKFIFWDGTVEDKSQLIVPSPNESRVIYYESCRGLEAWAVACFAIDKFFNQKREDPDAEKFLIEDMFLNQNNEQRKSMYAATWVLMALTRVIDTQYIQINDINSEFGKVVNEYLQQGNKNVRQMAKHASS
jgi:hypothetical protein